MEWPLIALITIGLVFVALQRRAPEPTRWMVSVQPEPRPAGWGWLTLLLAAALVAVMWMGWR